MKAKFLKHACLMPLISISCGCLGQDFDVGVRGGTSIDGNSGRFQETELFSDLTLPWRWNVCSDLVLQPRVDTTAGWLGGEHNDAFVGSLGPAIGLRKGRCPLWLEGGSSPTFLSQSQFGDKNLGCRFQFTSHIGLIWDITKHVSVGWRFQHMSNAGMGNSNPGLNLQMVEISYRF
jgi:hypothetical protein